MGRAWAETTDPRTAALATTNAVNGFSHLTLTAFRGFRDFTLEIEARSLVFTGPNGGGKTNLLEAISYLAPGSGLRSASLREVDCRLPANNANSARA